MIDHFLVKGEHSLVHILLHCYMASADRDPNQSGNIYPIWCYHPTLPIVIPAARNNSVCVYLQLVSSPPQD